MRSSTTIYGARSRIVYMTVGERLRELRESHGLTLEQAGLIAGTTKQSASQIEKGITKAPGGIFLYRWSRHYGVDLEWLITGKGVKQQGSQPARLTAGIIRSAARMAIGAIEAKGLPKATFQPFDDDLSAELLALAIEEAAASRIEDATDSDVLRFARVANRGGNESARAVGPNGEVGRHDGRKEAGEESKSPARKRRERAA